MADAPVLAVVGGGRWARVYLSVLCSMPQSRRPVAVSRHGAAHMHEAHDAAGRPVEVLGSLDELLDGPRPAGAIVVNAAGSHAASALRLLEAGVPVLVEKPAATELAAAARMVALARTRGVPLVPALTYRHCAYLDRFAQVVRQSGPLPARLRLAWADPVAETRHGERKRYDRGTGLAMDVMPHVWAILASVLGCRDMHLEDCRIERGGRRLVVRLRAGSVPCDVELERDAAARRRLLEVEGGASIDFTQEPGTIDVAGQRASGDPDWAARADRPVRRQLEAFFGALGRGPVEDSLADLQATVDLATACDSQAKLQQLALLAATPATRHDGDVDCALAELLSQQLVARGVLAPGDLDGLERELTVMRQGAARSPAANWRQVLDARA